MKSYDNGNDGRDGVSGKRMEILEEKLEKGGGLSLVEITF